MAQINTPARRRKQAAPIGLLFILLAAIGLGAVLLYSINITKAFIDNSDQKTKYEEFILPVLMFDPVPFEDARDLDPLVLLQSSMWSALLGDKRGSYQYDDMAQLLVPASDLDVACARLFGPNVTLEHQSFSTGNYETTFVYDEDIQTYHVPVQAQMGNYTPRIDTITKKGDTLALRVGYIPPATLWTADEGNAGANQEAHKYMLYILTKNKKDYYLSAIRDVEGAGLPSEIYGGSSQSFPDIPQIAPGSSSQEDSPGGESGSEPQPGDEESQE